MELVLRCMLGRSCATYLMLFRGLMDLQKVWGNVLYKVILYLTLFFQILLQLEGIVLNVIGIILQQNIIGKLKVNPFPNIDAF